MKNQIQMRWLVSGYMIGHNLFCFVYKNVDYLLSTWCKLNKGNTLPTKVCLVKAMVFPVIMFGCESWTVKKAGRQRIDALLEKTLESPLDSKEIQPVHPKGNQSWICIGRTDAETEMPILWSLDVKNWLIWKDHDVRRDWRWEEKRMTKDKMIGWRCWLNGHEFE